MNIGQWIYIDWENVNHPTTNPTNFFGFRSFSNKEATQQKIEKQKQLDWRVVEGLS